MIPVFKAAAEELLSSSDLTPADILAKALANAAVSSLPLCVSNRFEVGRFDITRVYLFYRVTLRLKHDHFSLLWRTMSLYFSSVADPSTHHRECLIIIYSYYLYANIYAKMH